jgi:hypothetical protein
MNPEPRDRQLARDVPMQEQPREGNDKRRKHHPAAE